METEEREHIRANLAELIKVTNCSPGLLASLHQQKILSVSDLAALDAERNVLEKSRELYKIVQTKSSSFAILVESLLNDFQTGAAFLLGSLYQAGGNREASLRGDIQAQTEARVRSLLSSWEGGAGGPGPSCSKGTIWFDVKAPADLFTGREDELAEMHQQILNSLGKQLVVSQVTTVTGLGGIGKTELVRKYIQVHQATLQNVIWLEAEEEVNLEEAFRRLAKDNLGISTKDANGGDKEMKSVIKEVYDRLSNRDKTLIVFDNAEKGPLLEKFMPLKGLTSKPFIIITSREREWPDGMEIFTVRELKLDDAISLVKSGLLISDDKQDGVVKQLVQTLQCFPLAMRQAIAFIREEQNYSDYTIEQYLEEFEENLKDLLDSEAFKSGLFHDYDKTTYTTWKITVGKIGMDPKVGELSLKILNWMSYLAPDSIPKNMFSGFVGDDPKGRKLSAAVKLLERYSMINSEQRQNILHIHRLVQSVTRVDLQQHENKESKVLSELLETVTKSSFGKTDVHHRMSVIAHIFKNHHFIGSRLQSVELFWLSLFDDGMFSEPPEVSVFDLETLNDIVALFKHFSFRFLFQVLALKILLPAALKRYKETFQVCSKRSGESNVNTELLKFKSMCVLRLESGVEIILKEKEIGRFGVFEMFLTLLKFILSVSEQVPLPESNDYILYAANRFFITHCGESGKLNRDFQFKILAAVYDKLKPFLGPFSPKLMLALTHRYAHMLLQSENFDEAAKLFKEAYEERRELLGDEDPVTISSKNLWERCVSLSKETGRNK